MLAAMPEKTIQMKQARVNSSVHENGIPKSRPATWVSTTKTMAATAMPHTPSVKKTSTFVASVGSAWF
jgi:hypothetical protein